MSERMRRLVLWLCLLGIGIAGYLSWVKLSDTVAFCGGISDQRLGTQTPAQVRDEVRWLIDTLGAPFDNAYVLAPANSLMPEIPLENLVALFEACHDQ